VASIPLVGPTYQSKSVAAECQRTINWYVEAMESQQGKAPAVLYPTPGLRALAGWPGGSTGSWRGLYATSQPAAAAVGVVGGVFYQLTQVDARRPVTALAGTSRGGVANDGNPCSFAENGVVGHQVLVASGGTVYLWDTVSGAALTTPSILIDDGSGPKSPGPIIAVAYMDGVFIAIAANSFQVSDDIRRTHVGGASWDPTKYARRSEGADGIVTGLQNRRELWLLGQVTSEVWYNTGATDFQFAPIPGVFIEYGCVAPYSACRFDSSVAWLGQSRDGDRVAILAQQYLPQRVSTHAIEEVWRTYARVDDAVSWVYQDEGHTFWVLQFPSAQATWVYDAATQLWHERGYWNTATASFEAHRASCHAMAFGAHLVGDRATGQLYALDSGVSVDQVPEKGGATGGTAIRRVRRTPHLSQENVLMRHQKLELELESGLGLAVGQGQHPQAMLRWSDDRAHTWTSEWWLDTSPMGTYGRRADWWRLGRSRDRVYELTVSDPIPWRLSAAYLDVAGGTS